MQNNSSHQHEDVPSDYYQCNTPRIGALTKMVLDQEYIVYRKVVTTTDKQFEERYYVEVIRDNHWLENKTMILEMEAEMNSTLKACYHYEIAIRQV